MTANRPARGRRPGPLPPGPLFTPGASRPRQAVEQRSAAPLLYLRGLPTWLAPAILVAVLIAGLAVRGVIGGLCLLLVAVALGWLAAVSWPRLTPAGRMGRLTVVALVVAGAVIQALR